MTRHGGCSRIVSEVRGDSIGGVVVGGKERPSKSGRGTL
jgi:hypothetical protein